MGSKPDNHSLPPFKSEWIKRKNGFSEETIDFTESLGRHLAKNGLTSTQIRNVYEEVKRIEATLKGKMKDIAASESQDAEDGADFEAVKTDFLLLRPKIAYAAKRAGGRGMTDFKDVMDKAHSAVFDGANQVQSFTNFSKLFEAILAYHKVYGGRD